MKNRSETDRLSRRTSKLENAHFQYILFILEWFQVPNPDGRTDKRRYLQKHPKPSQNSPKKCF